MKGEEDTMTYLEFLALPAVQKANSVEATQRMWYHIYVWVQEHGYADTADSPDFVQYVKTFRSVNVETIASHLARMANADLLKRNVLKRKLSAEAKEELLNPIATMFTGSSLPTMLIRYTLPGVSCPLEFKSAERQATRIHNSWSKMLNSTADPSQFDFGSFGFQ